MIQTAVILCAGKSTRTFPLTETRPKALLKVANKIILSLLLDALDGVVKEVVLIVNYKKEMIEEVFGKQYKNLKIIYVEQKEVKGTGHAVQQAENSIKGDSFLIIGGDDYFDKRDIQKVVQYQNALFGQEVEHPGYYGVLEINDKQELIGIEEKPKKPKTKIVNTGCYVVDKTIFSCLKKVKKSKRGEYELTDAVKILAKEKQVRVIKAEHWHPITYPWHLLDVNKKMLQHLQFKNEGKIEQGVTIHGAVQIGKGTILKSGTYIEGPVLIGENCTIGPNCYIRPETTVGNNVKIGNAVEVKNSILGSKTHIGHLSYLGDSVLGENVNFGAGTIVANLRHDNKTIQSEVNGKLVDSARRKLGVIIGDNVHTGVNTSMYPGRKLWPEILTLPGEVIKYDKK